MKIIRDFNTPPESGDFSGAKLILLLGRNLVVLRRDHTPGIPWPGMLDFPGGGREADETPELCVLRETREEIGLCLTPADLHWKHLRHGDGNPSWFFAAKLPAVSVRDIIFGGEGTGWQLMPPARFLDRADAIPHFQRVLSLYLAQTPV